jgi:phosphoribosylaminoimidazole-succinocarboxamide synthase
MEVPFLTLMDHGLAPTRSGKVREILDLGDQLLMVTTDRISAFDCVLPTPIPGKGRLLNRISAFWLRGLEKFVPTHLITDREDDFPNDIDHLLPALRDRWMLVRKAERIPIECIVRGYLAGSGMAEYQKKGTVGGIEVPEGIPPFGKLPTPLFTPTTKEEEGHDQPVTFEELSAEVGAGLSQELRELSLRIYRLAESYSRAQGLILADTKFEFGRIEGRLCLIDEALTPDSSRYWAISDYEAGSPEPMDKEYVRGYLKTLDWDRNPPAPELGEEQIAETYRRYEAVYDALGAKGQAPRLDAEGVDG